MGAYASKRQNVRSPNSKFNILRSNIGHYVILLTRKAPLDLIEINF
jgi:hypothetical protein